MPKSKGRTPPLASTARTRLSLELTSYYHRQVCLSPRITSRLGLCAGGGGRGPERG